LICEPQIKKQLLKLLDPFSGLLDLTWFLIRATHELGLSLLSDATKVPEGLDAVQVEKEYGLSIPSWFEDRLDLLSYNSRRLYALIAQALIRNMGGELLRDGDPERAHVMCFGLFVRGEGGDGAAGVAAAAEEEMLARYASLT
ncbi:testicular acid phosphatase, partial [Ixodes scapularis]